MTRLPVTSAEREGFRQQVLKRWASIRLRQMGSIAERAAVMVADPLGLPQGQGDRAGGTGGEDERGD